jgi:hypothetical protein
VALASAKKCFIATSSDISLSLVSSRCSHLACAATRAEMRFDV